jgi:hypothetical protein
MKRKKRLERRRSEIASKGSNIETEKCSSADPTMTSRILLAVVKQTRFLTMAQFAAVFSEGETRISEILKRNQHIN